MNQTVIVKYPAGNVLSVMHALNRLGENALWTDDPDKIKSASRVIFPGVGEASTAMDHLRKTGLNEVLINLQQPVLGICLGLQLFCRHSEENDTTCLGIFDVPVLKFRPSGAQKVPHMGWNALEAPTGRLFENVPAGSYMYFVHSCYAALDKYTCAQTTHIETFSAALARDNFFAVQFHPEKSGETGQRILYNFLKIK